ncbi:MAG: hypothetical protein ACE5G2_01635 [Candidatus Krumholzibacteriia bacterium]
MNLRRTVFLAVLISFAVAPAAAQNNTDLEAVRTILYSPGFSRPVVGESLLVKLEIRNNGPDAYAAGAHGNISATVDIDEPSKPGLPGLPGLAACSGHFAGSFAVDIGVGGNVILDLGGTGAGGIGVCPNIRATGTVTAGGGANDTNSANNTRVDYYRYVEAPQVPATGWLGLAAIGAILAGTVAWHVRRRRRSSPERAV